MVKETHDRSLFGGRFAVGLQCFLSGNGSDLVESFFDHVFWVLSLKKEVGHFLNFFFEVCIVLAQTAKSKKLGERDAVFGTGVVR